MTQRSRPQADNNATLVYTDSGPYSRDQWAQRMRAAHTGDTNTASNRTRIRGVVPTYDNLLVTTISGTDVVVGTGAGMVFGTYLFNDATVTFSPPAAAANTHIDLVCLVENNTNAAVATDSAGNTWTFPNDLTDYNAVNSVPAYTARLVIISGADNVAPVAPTLDQLTTLYCVPIAQYTISTVPAISAFVDRREFVDVETIVGVATGDNDDIEEAAIIGTQVTNGAGANGLGVAIRAKLENSTGDLENAGQMAFRWTDATNASEDSRWELRLAAGNADNLSAVINAPTTATADGNVRGAGAVDLQQTRSAVAQVASGAGSTISGGVANIASGAYAVVGGGAGNTASNTSAVVGGGADNTASNTYATISGGFDNSATADGSAVCGGYTNTASGVDSFVGGGDTNTASGLISTIAGGRENIASADYTTVGGGYENEATEDYVTIGGGYNNEASGDYSTIAGGYVSRATGDYSAIPGGSLASAPLYGQVAHASGYFADFGDAQGTIQLVARCTTGGGGVAAILYLDGAGATQRMTIPARTAWTYDISVVGISQNVGAYAGFWQRGIIRRDNANNTTLTAFEAAVGTASGGQTVTIAADDANEALQISFNDNSVAVHRVVATVRLAQVTYP